MKGGQCLGFMTAGLLLAATAGCVLETPLSVRRLWADYNTLRAPALFYDKFSHEPPPSYRVKEYRWMYNKGPHDIGPYSLIPPAKGTLPLPAPPEPGGLPSKDATTPVPEPRDGPLIPHTPQPPSGPDGQPSPGKPPVPPLPDTSGRLPAQGPVARPPASSPRPRTARANDWWRFVR